MNGLKAIGCALALAGSGEMAVAREQWGKIGTVLVVKRPNKETGEAWVFAV